MDAEEALAKLRAAPSYAPVSQLGIPPPVLEALSSRPEYQELVVDGYRKRLTRSEVDERLPLYLKELRRQLRASVEPGGRKVNRRSIANDVGLSYSAVRNRTQKNHDDYMPGFADAEKEIYDEIILDTEDRYVWLVNQPVTGEHGSEQSGYSVKQMNPMKELLRLRHPDFKDSKQLNVTGQIGHMHVHGLLTEELGEIAGRFQKPTEKVLES